MQSNTCIAWEKCLNHDLIDCFRSYNVFFCGLHTLPIEELHSSPEQLSCIFFLLNCHEDMPFSHRINTTANPNCCNQKQELNWVYLCYWSKCLLIVNSVGLCKTFSMSLALYSSMEPSALCFTIYIHLDPTAFFLLGHSTRSRVLFFYEWLSSLSALLPLVPLVKF